MKKRKADFVSAGFGCFTGSHGEVLRAEVKSPDEAAGPSLTNSRPSSSIDRSDSSGSDNLSQRSVHRSPPSPSPCWPYSPHATAQQMGFLRAAEFAPFLILTLPAGVWADLGIRKSLMILSNLIRGVLIVFVPVAIFLGLVRLEVLYVVMLVMGSFKVIFEMAYQTYIPEIVDRETLVNANAR